MRIRTALCCAILVVSAGDTHAVVSRLPISLKHAPCIHPPRELRSRSVPLRCGVASGASRPSTSAPLQRRAILHKLMGQSAGSKPRRSIVQRFFGSTELLLLGMLQVYLGAALAASSFVELYDAYSKVALQYPIITKSLTSGVAYLLGDAIAQKFGDFCGSIDKGRLTRCSIAGLVSHGPQLHFWTTFLEHSGLSLLVMIALDQTFFALYINAAFCICTELLCRRSLVEAFARAKSAALPCLVAGWRFWPFVHLITYSLIPLHMRVLFVDVLEVIWVSILSTCVANSKVRAWHVTNVLMLLSDQCCSRTDLFLRDSLGSQQPGHPLRLFETRSRCGKHRAQPRMALSTIDHWSF